MIHVNVLLSLIRHQIPDVPVALYMHENQLTYPWSDNDPDTELKRDNHYGFINYASALAADRVIFNSQYHQDSFLAALPDFLRQFPDFKNLNSINTIEQNSEVLPIGVDLEFFDNYPETRNKNSVPVLLWNHRWEYDKNPKGFYELVKNLDDKNIDFELIICGGRGDNYPRIFDTIKDQYGQRLHHFGYAKGREEYAKLLKMADVLPVTSNQDFFGISIVEAMYCGVCPILPDRLTYPWLIGSTPGSFLYTTQKELLELTVSCIGEPLQFPSEEIKRRFNWLDIIADYDEFFENLVAGSP